MRTNSCRIVAVVLAALPLISLEASSKEGSLRQSMPSLFSLKLVSREGRIAGSISNISARTWSVYFPRGGFEGGVSLDISYNDTNRVRHVYNTSYIRWENIEHLGEWVTLRPGRNVKFDQSLPSDIADDFTIEGFPDLARCSISGSLTAAIRYWDAEVFEKEKDKRPIVADPWERRLFENCLLWECDVDIKSVEHVEQVEEGREPLDISH